MHLTVQISLNNLNEFGVVLPHVCKALLGKLPFHLTSLLKVKSIFYKTRSQEFTSLEAPQINTNLVKLAFNFSHQIHEILFAIICFLFDFVSHFIACIVVVIRHMSFFQTMFQTMTFS